MEENRFDRNIRFFGKTGQESISQTDVVVVGVGGLGTHVVQQLALLGVRSLTLIDMEELETTNLNRYIGVRWDDPIPGTKKVDIGERIVREINPKIEVTSIPSPLISKEAFDAIKNTGIVFGCLDNEGPRLVLNELCAAYSKPYFDLASDIDPKPPMGYGGRVGVAWDGSGCLVCNSEIDIAEAQADLLSPEARKNRAAIYGVALEELDTTGPSVVSINGVVASLAVTEFMLAITGIRSPKQFLTYHGNLGIITVKKETPFLDCYYCKGIRGKGDKANTQKYLKA